MVGWIHVVVCYRFRQKHKGASSSTYSRAAPSSTYIHTEGPGERTLEGHIDNKGSGGQDVSVVR